MNCILNYRKEVLDMQSIYTEKEILGDALAAQKAATAEMNTAANECVHEDVRQTLMHILNQEHEIQQDVFEMMHQRGFYETPEAEDATIENEEKENSTEVTNEENASEENTTTENRKNGPGTPPFFFDALYDCKTRASTESHIVKVPFIDRTINVHERIKEPVQRVSKRINDLPRDTPELKKFFSTLARTDGFAWRNVRDSKSR